MKGSLVEAKTVATIVMSLIIALISAYLLVSSVMLLANQASAFFEGINSEDESLLTLGSGSGNAANGSEYVLPDSDSRYYSYAELDALSDEQLNFAHNEIYARHGRIFNDKRYAEHFEACSWYRPRYSAEEYDAMPSQLNEYEKANSDLMAQIRSERGIR